MATAAKFELGKIMYSAGVVKKRNEDGGFVLFVRHCLRRHSEGDWGELDSRARQTNDAAILDGSRIISTYAVPDASPNPEKARIWILTERDRSATMVFFLSEELDGGNRGT
jgi:hypothetical protein